MDPNERVENVTYESKHNNHLAVRNLTINALMLAFLVLCSQIVIPLPGSIPITLQTLAVAIIAYTLRQRDSIIVILAYLVLGFLGLPFFAGFTGGPAKLFTASAGYLIGFIPMLILLGLSARVYPKNKILAILLSILGLATCHVLGVFWLSDVAKIGIAEAFAMGSLPFLLKDIVSLIVAFLISMQLKKKLRLNWEA